tara:strand:- start:230 stop:1543 length:1314 start_codon:yes stop_codon:yes gene_type:complete
MTDEEFERMLAGLPEGNQGAMPRQPVASSASRPAFTAIPDRRDDSFLKKAGRFAMGFGAGYAGRGDEYLESLENKRKQKDMRLLQATALDARAIQQAIQSENMPKAIDVLVDRMNLLEQMGEDTSDTKMLRDALIGGRPDIVMGELNTFLSSLPKQTIDPKFVTSEGQMITQRLGGDPMAQTIAGYQTDPEDSYRPLTPEELVAYRLSPDAPYRLNIKTNKPEYMGGTTSTTTIRNPASIPSGYRGIYDDDGNLIELEAIAGGPAAADEAEIQAGLDADIRREGLRTSRQSKIGGIVLEDIGRYRTLINNQGIFTPITGVRGELAGRIAGTPAFDARSLANTIGANVQFEALGQMREESKTGGALGSITRNELEDLKATLGSIAAAQSDDQLLYNLNRLEQLYTTVMEKASSYSEEDRQKYGITIPLSQGTDPLGLF